MITLFVDADACPVKDEIYVVATRYGVPVALVANARMHVPQGFGVELILVDGAPDAADDWIAENARAADVVVTADILLAARCLARRRSRARLRRPAVHRGFDRRRARHTRAEGLPARDGRGVRWAARPLDEGSLALSLEARRAGAAQPARARGSLRPAATLATGALSGHPPCTSGLA